MMESPKRKYMKTGVPANSKRPFDLERFVRAQKQVYETAREELRVGRKRTHWMWFIFPQMKGLGSSYEAEFFGMVSLAEATAYLAHPVLGPRLRECTQLVNNVEGRSSQQIFGDIDALKFRSSMTLFARATPDNTDFKVALDKYYGGKEDPLTLNLS